MQPWKNSVDGQNLKLLSCSRKAANIGQAVQKTAAHRNTQPLQPAAPVGPPPAAKLAKACCKVVWEGYQGQEAQPRGCVLRVQLLLPLRVRLVLPAHRTAQHSTDVSTTQPFMPHKASCWPSTMSPTQGLLGAKNLSAV